MKRMYEFVELVYEFWFLLVKPQGVNKRIIKCERVDEDRQCMPHQTLHRKERISKTKPSLLSTAGVSSRSGITYMTMLALICVNKA